ncbi:MAG: ABC transporter permease [Candidatus Acidiferrales bacterium]
METLLQDVRFGFRMLLKSPGFTALAVLALALGIGANTAVFSVAIAFLKKPVALPNLDRLVMVLNLAPDQTTGWNDVAPADYLDWKKQAQTFEEMGATQQQDANFTGKGEPERVAALLASANFFDVVGVPPAMGRPFLPEEEQVGHDQEVVISYGLWQRRFGSDPNVLGKTAMINDRSYTIVGVTSKDFDFPGGTQVYLPLALTDQQKADRAHRYIDPIARLKPGITLRNAAAEIWTIQQRLRHQYPQAEQDWRTKVMPLGVFVSGELTDQYCEMLIVAVLFVLLIACANVANLLFARSASRLKEVALRRALGANRFRVIRQLLTESVMLAIVGAALGLLLGQWGIGLLRHYMPPEIERELPAWRHVRMEMDVFLYTVAITFAAGLISGLAPAFHTSKADVYEELKEGGRGGTTGRNRQRMRSVFVVAEVALSLILLMGAGLMTKGVRALLVVNQNLDPGHVLTMKIVPADSKYKTPQQKASFYQGVLEQLQAIPGVQSAAVAAQVPFGDYGDTEPVSIQDRPPQPGEFRQANFDNVNAGYFQTIKIPLLDGRYISDADGPDQPPVAVVSESFVRRYFARENPLGKMIKQGQSDSDQPWARIVGVVADVKYDPYARQETPPVYLPYRQSPPNLGYLAIKTTGDPTTFGAAVRSAIDAVDPDQPIDDVWTLQKVISNQLLGLSYVAVMLSALGAIALVLASIGVYGVMAYSVSERTHEIGVRLALGAQRRDVMNLVLTRGVILTSIGLLIGLPISVALAQLLAGVIFGVSAGDFTTFAGTTLLLCAITMLACYIPARRAMSVDPIVALRYE